jgi:cytidylate kinase
MGFIIAVDGPAASGKGTIAVKLGALYGYPVLDSGLLYRAVGMKVLAEGGDLSDEAAATAAARSLVPSELEGPVVRTRAAGEAASPEARAERRWKQLVSQGEPVTYEEILADIHVRDARDSARADSPMVAAPDAVLLDTTEMTIDAAFDAARRIVEAARSRWETAKG